MTWKEVKLATLQKMFSAEGLVINEADDSVSEYLNAGLLAPEPLEESFRRFDAAYAKLHP